jgi:serine/threonine protein phosphatase PrpC
MEFLTAYHTDVGIKKKVNQDSMLVMQASTPNGNVLLAVVADGMGGLAAGELVSAVVCNELRSWFMGSFASIIAKPYDNKLIDTLQQDLVGVIRNANDRILDYSERKHVSCGTTCIALLIVGSKYIVCNVGDSRAYMFGDSLYQLSKDQTVVQADMDAGKITAEQAKKDPRRNVLTQCIGANGIVNPQLVTGDVKPETLFMLCSDGFRHIIEPKEFWDHLNPQMNTNPQQLKNNLVYLTDLNKHRRESDNISALAVRVNA